MGAALDILSWMALAGGGFFYVVGVIGLNRMPRKTAWVPVNPGVIF